MVLTVSVLYQALEDHTRFVSMMQALLRMTDSILFIFSKETHKVNIIQVILI